jgi:hypothetical protein
LRDDTIDEVAGGVAAEAAEAERISTWLDIKRLSVPSPTALAIGAVMAATARLRQSKWSCILRALPMPWVRALPAAALAEACT